jgi:hypothetical protein
VIPNERTIKCVKEVFGGPDRIARGTPTPANDPAGMGALNYSRVAQKTLLAVVFTSIRVPVTIPWM